MKYLLSLALGILLISSSCKQQEAAPTLATKEFLSKDLPASFMDFYERFHNDEAYQLEHIIFPLSGQEQDSITMVTQAMQWPKESWIPHKPFNSYGGTFKRDFTNLNGIILEKIQDTGKTFTMERRFTFMQGDWNLIYYSTFEMKE